MKVCEKDVHIVIDILAIWIQQLWFLPIDIKDNQKSHIIGVTVCLYLTKQLFQNDNYKHDLQLIENDQL